jgi:hypothetical protein
MNFITTSQADDPTIKEYKWKYICTTTTPKKSQWTPPTHISETHLQLSSQAAREAHATHGPSNKGHPVYLSTSQTHKVATLWLRRPKHRQKRYHARLQQEAEGTEIHHHQQTVHTTTKTLNESATPSTSHSEEHREDQEDQEGPEDQEDLEDREDTQCLPLTLYLSHQEQT